MPLASSGMRALKPTGGGNAFLHTNHQAHTARSIHIPSFVPRPTASQSSSTAQTLFKHTRTLLSRFVAHLTTPGTLRVPGAARTLHHGAARMPTIQQGLSLSARMALARPLRAPHLPRVPAVPQRMNQVGLGLARNFSTARPVFQNLVENVPVSGRALWEADWDVKMQKEKERTLKKYVKEKAAKKARKERLQPRAEKKALTTEEVREAEMNHYFPEAPKEDVITHLLIPLAPTQSSRVPLPIDSPLSSATHPLLPLSILGNIHSMHGTQTLRVSSLFARLDAARVFELPEVHCEALGDLSGLCTLLEITFDGWDEACVRSVLGEAGKGWCVIEEVRKDKDAEEKQRIEDILETMSSDGGASWSDVEGGHVDPARSLVLPTLDFSASFTAATQSHPPSFPVFPPSSLVSPFSDIEFHNAWSTVERVRDDDIFSDEESLDLASEVSWAESELSTASILHVPDQAGMSDGWFGVGFSSSFAGRMRESEGPNEAMF